MVLSIKAISWADRSAFVGDWFNNQAPQPHVLFDAITFLGEKMNFLAGVYFLYYLASCLVFAVGTAILAEIWLPKKLQFLQHIVNVLVVTGPVFLLGTFLTIHFQAVPNMAGACLVYLSVACLITNKEKEASCLMVLTGLFHLQHGIIISIIGLLFVVFGLVGRKKLIAKSSITTLAVSMSIAVYRDLLSGSSEIAHEVSEIGSTSHFNVETWGHSVISGGLFVLALAVLNFFLSDNKSRRVRKFALFLLVALGPVVGIISDLNNIEPIQSMARSLFVYRFSMVLAPFACWFIVRQFAYAMTKKLVFALCASVILLVSFHRYFSVSYTDFPSLGSWQASLCLCGLVFFGRILSRPVFTSDKVLPSIFVVLLIITMGVGISKFHSTWPKIDYSAADNAVIISRSMSKALMPNDVLAADPSIPWLRLLTRRAIVADCKGAPYGGNPWNEFTRRLRALGVDRPNTCIGYKTQPLSAFLKLRDSVGATTLLLLPDDNAYNDAREQLIIRWSSGGNAPWLIFELPSGNI